MRCVSSECRHFIHTHSFLYDCMHSVLSSHSLLFEWCLFLAQSFHSLHSLLLFFVFKNKKKRETILWPFFSLQNVFFNIFLIGNVKKANFLPKKKSAEPSILQTKSSPVQLAIRCSYKYHKQNNRNWCVCDSITFFMLPMHDNNTTMAMSS